MYGMGYDPEATIQDADIEMAEMRDAANEQEARCEAGEHATPRSNGSGSTYCVHCGRLLS